MTSKNMKDKGVSVVFAGEAGQGIDTITLLISKIYKKCGYNVCLTKEYMSRIRGGINSSEIRISKDRVNAYTDTIDFLFALIPEAIEYLKKRITKETLIFKVEPSERYKNTYAAGMLFGLTAISSDIPEQMLRVFLEEKGEQVINKNLETFKKGYEKGRELSEEKAVKINIDASEEVKNEMFMNGTEAIALGCVAGGCNFISSYPMSPATGVFIELVKASDRFDIITEQAEDEISSMNMNIGAWYAGARAIVTTSGGGFDLMTEALSLAGIIESPMVIHIGQRPGPATGLPTKTEQGDLELALYAGHGEFPRIIYAPGSLEECYELAKAAFINADKYQMPVFLLSDQYLLERSYNIPVINVSEEKINQNIIKTEKDYKRYQFTDNGLSPRGIPGYGDGLVCVDSDEHDEDGHLTEDCDLRVKMIHKRRKKLDLALQNSIMPEFIGNPDYKILLLGWGSAKNSIIEALRLCKRNDLAFLHFKQVFPLPPETKKLLTKAKKLVAIENNTNGQLARLIRTEFCINIDKNILKYDGLPFSADKLAKEIGEL
ncbi:MAG TPA: 2-oxoacid:acceptor oxidoreductase subunit alpha [Candidatus Gastranaerophilales bacterium]|nr:2-oxoacid:acceptor oxidoreductase subunit alpha [Candidatus Gastranaerophilales bacterium]